MNETRKGELFVLGTSFTWSFYPFIAILLQKSIPAVTSLMLSYAVALVLFMALAAKRRSFGAFKDVRAVKGAAIAAVFLAASFMLIFIGIQYTTTANAALLGLLEFFFAYIFFNIVRGEKITTLETAGAALVILGAAFIFIPEYLKSATLNRGDLLVAAAMALTPFLQFYQRRARKTIPSEVILIVRTAVGVPLMIAVAYFLGEHASLSGIVDVLVLILINGIILFGFSKIWWLESIHRLPVTKAVALAGTAPLFTMIFAYFILGDIPTTFQLIAFFPLFLGAILLMRRVAPPAGH